MPRSFPIFLAVVLTTVPRIAFPAVAGAVEKASGNAVAAPSGSAQEFEAWHIVRPGDTLEGLSGRYLGDPERWPENWRLNPQVQNPHKLTPGERLKIKILERPTEPDAVLRRKSRAVDDKLGPRNWDNATENDLLLDRDGVRTGAKSSTELAFNDGARLVVTEDSLLFLRQQGGTLQAQPVRGVEIREGTADIAMSARATQFADVEIVMGEARATSKSASGAESQSRARHASSGNAEFMVYRGEGAVEAAGSKVAVPEGTGTAVPPHGAPMPPEALLAAAAILEPASGAALTCASPLVRWSPVVGAVSYVVEICQDANCATLIDRATGVAGAQWRAPALVPGSYFARVTARSANGLDGYSTNLPFQVSATASAPTTTSSTGATAQDMSIVATGVMAQRGDTLWIDSRSQLTVVNSRGVAATGFMPSLDGKPVGFAAWGGGWTPGPHTASAVGANDCGATATLATVRFAVDLDAPAVTWDRVNLAPSGAQLEAKETEQHHRFPPPIRRPLPAQLEWSLDGISWIPFSWGVPLPWRRGPHLPPASWYSTLDDPESPGRLPAPVDEATLYLRAPQANPFRAAAPVNLSGWTALAVKVRDTESGVARLYPRPVELLKGDWVLRIETADQVGNRKVIDWPLVPKSEK
ncbi:MAG: LysM peptidoglycan-binding domain-containing protein [Acidobacteriota bacterium]